MHKSTEGRRVPRRRKSTETAAGRDLIWEKVIADNKLNMDFILAHLDDYDNGSRTDAAFISHIYTVAYSHGLNKAISEMENKIHLLFGKAGNA